MISGARYSGVPHNVHVLENKITECLLLSYKYKFIKTLVYLLSIVQKQNHEIMSQDKSFVLKQNKFMDNHD